MCAERGRARLCDLDDASLDLMAVLLNRQRLAAARIARLENENREARAQVRQSATTRRCSTAARQLRLQLIPAARAGLPYGGVLAHSRAAAAAAGDGGGGDGGGGRRVGDTATAAVAIAVTAAAAAAAAATAAGRHVGPTARAEAAEAVACARAGRACAKSNAEGHAPQQHHRHHHHQSTTNNKTRTALRPSVHAIASPPQQDPRAHTAPPTPTQIIAATRLQAAVRGNAARGIAARRALYARVGVHE